MKYRSLPKANFKVSEISFGCMSLGTDQSENNLLIKEAFEAGVNYFDTADIYQNGFNEETVGKAVRPFRKDIILATKVGNQAKKDGIGWEWGPSKNYILKATDKSLKRLNADYVDILQLHGGTIEDNRDEVIEAFEILQEQGKIRHYAISSIRPNVIEAYVQESEIVSDMLQYSLLDRRAEEKVLDLLHEKQIGVMVRGGLARGLIVNKPLSDYLGYSAKDIEIQRDKLNSFSIEKISMAQLALKWVLFNKAVTSIVLGLRTMEHLSEALGVFNTPGLSPDDYKELGSVLTPNKYTDHRRDLNRK